MTEAPRPESRRGRAAAGRAAGVLLVVFAWLCALGGAVLMLLYARPQLQLTNDLTALAASFIPYGILSWSAATLLLGWAARRWMKSLAVLTLVCLIVQIVWARPYWPGTQPPAGEGESLTVLTMNLRCDEPALSGLVEVVERERPDIVVLQDLSQEGWDYLQGTSWWQTLPQHSMQPKDQPLAAAETDPCGSVVFAHATVTQASASDAAQPVVSVALPSGSLTVVPVSLPALGTGLDPWLLGFETLDATLASHTSVGTATAPMLVIGDFNATREHLPMRKLIAEHDLVDAAEQARAGWQPTFPADRRYPPLVAIDHVLLSPSLTASEVSAFSVKYGAHRGLIARLGPA